VDSLADFSTFEFEHDDKPRTVYRRGSGPAVIVMHEIPGITPEVARFSRYVSDAGMTVFMPHLFGVPGKTATKPYVWKELARACISHEFRMFAENRSSPIVDWLRALARKVHAECGGPGVGAIGMCFSGGFALAMMTEPSVIAPVLSQPSMPFGFTRRSRAAIGMSAKEVDGVRQRLQTENLSILGLRFHGDPFVPPERFATYKDCFGERFEAIEIDPAQAQPYPGMKPHAVLTINLRDDDPDGATKRAEVRVIEFFRQRLQPSSTTAS
jgi:dienelactone hydrolase